MATTQPHHDRDHGYRSKLPRASISRGRGTGALLSLLLLTAACGGADNASPAPAPSSDRSTQGPAAQVGLDGVSFEVHRDPG